MATCVNVVDTMSPLTLCSGLVLGSVSCSEPPSLRRLSGLVLEVEDEDAALCGEVGISGSRQLATASATVRWMVSLVTAGESGSKKLRAFGLPPTNNSPLPLHVYVAGVTVEPLPLELPDLVVVAANEPNVDELKIIEVGQCGRRDDSVDSPSSLSSLEPWSSPSKEVENSSRGSSCLWVSRSRLRKDRSDLGRGNANPMGLPGPGLRSQLDRFRCSS